MGDWSQTAFLFPGQGSQEVGMGATFAEAYSVARETFEAADAILGFALSKMCWEGPPEILNDTVNTQPALYVTSIATLRALEAELGQVPAVAFIAGHSLGELTALTAAGSLAFDDGLRLVRERGRLMKQAGETTPGAMAALLGLSIEAVAAICAQVTAEDDGVLVIANDNCPGQVVISGDDSAVERGIALAQDAGAKRAIKLAVSVATHSPLMVAACDPFRKVLADITFQPPRIPVMGNVHAQPLPADADAIRDELVAQLTSPVRWTEGVQAMIAAGITCFVEIGSKDVLSGLVRRIDRKRERFALNSIEALDKFAQAASAN